MLRGKIMADARTIMRGGWYRPLYRMHIAGNSRPQSAARDGFPEGAGGAGAGGPADGFGESLKGGDRHGDGHGLIAAIAEAHDHEALPVIVDYAADLSGIGPVGGEVAGWHGQAFLSVWERFEAQPSSRGAGHHG